MLTSADGPVVVGDTTMRALVAIRRQKLLPQLYDAPIVMARSNFEAVCGVLPEPPHWLNVRDDRPEIELPQRCETATASEAAAIRLALSPPPDRASFVLLEGPIKERAQLSFIKAQGTVSILVAAYRCGKLTAVRPMIKALERLGHAEVLPEPAMLDALWKALDDLD